MARDYARSRSSRRNARIGEVTPRGGRRPSGQRRLTAYRQPRGSRSFMWLVSGIVMGMLIAGGFYIKTCHHTDDAAKPATAVQTSNTSKHSSQDKKHGKSAAKSVENDTDSTESAMISEEENAEKSETTSAEPDNNAESAKTSSASTSSTHTKLNASKLGKKHAEADQPHYDFYTMLPKDAVETQQPTEKDKGKAKDKAQNKITATGRYQLQVASFTKLQDADHRKAELILQGYSASIHKQLHEGVVRYRVNIGPFNSSKAAVAQQQNLGKNKIKSIVVPL